MRVLTQFMQRLTRWAYCKICQDRTDQIEAREVWVCNKCHRKINHRGEPIAD